MANNTNSITAEINNTKPSLRDMINSKLLKQKAKLQKKLTEQINYHEWINCKPIRFDPRTKEEKESTIQYTNRN